MAPAPAMALIRLLHNHDLGILGAAWRGWRLKGEELTSPQGDRFSPGLVLAGRYYREIARDAERRQRLSGACETGPTSCEAASAFSPVSVT